MQYNFTNHFLTNNASTSLSCFSVVQDATPQNDNRPWNFASCYCDHGGCGYYRSRFITQEISQQHQNASFSESQFILPFDALYTSCRSLRLQRMHTPGELNFFMHYLLPLRQKNHFKLLFDLDDILVTEDIPQYNIYRDIFRHSEQTLPHFLANSDLVTVSTVQLRDYYSARFNIPRDHFAILPNYVPQFWADHYHPQIIVDRLRRHAGKRKRIGFSSCRTHFNLSGNTNLKDDLSILTEWLISNRKKYQFVFQGGISSALLPYKEDFEIHPELPFLHFLNERQQLDLDLLIQPLENNLFNRAKSIIKFYEAWATGMPIFVSDLPNFKEAGADCCFHDAEDLDHKIEELFASPEFYIRTVENNYGKMDQLWLHRHVESWLKIML